MYNMCIIKAKTLHIEGYKSYNNPSATNCYETNLNKLLEMWTSFLPSAGILH